MHYLGAGDQFIYITVVVLATIAIASSAAFACLLLAFLRQKRSTELLKGNKARFGVYHDNCQRVHVESLHGSEDSSRFIYEIRFSLFRALKLFFTIEP